MYCEDYRVQMSERWTFPNGTVTCMCLFRFPGESLTIKLDKLTFGRENNKFMEFLVTGALRNITPCKLEVYNLFVHTSVNDNEKLIESCTPFLALLGQDPQVVYTTGFIPVLVYLLPIYTL